MLEYVGGVFKAGVVVEVYIRDERPRRVAGESELDVAGLVARLEAVVLADWRKAGREVCVQDAGGL